MVKILEKLKYISGRAALVCFGLAATPAFAVDVMPFDWMPAPSGTSAVIIYSPVGHNDGAVLDGNDLDASLNSALIMPRYAYYFDIDNHPVVVTALVPMGSLYNASLGGIELNDDTSVGDVTVAAGYWLYSDPKERKNLAIAAYLNIPTGTYDPDQAINLSSGQFNGTIQVGGMMPLSERFTLETTADVTFYAKNRNSNILGQTQTNDPTFSIQNWLTYSIDAQTMVHLGHSISFGGEKYLDDVSTGFNSRKQQVKLGFTRWVTPTFSIYAHVSHDFDVKGGFKQDISGMLRLVKLF